MGELVGLQEELIIRRPSPELRVKAIETLPIPIRFVEVCLTAMGIDRYDGSSLDESVRDEYYRKCREGGIIPNCTLTLESSSNGLFYARSNQLRIAYGNFGLLDDKSIIGIREVMVQSLIRGGKFAAIKYEIENNATFSTFRQKYLHETLRQGYEIDSAHLALTSYRLTEYNQGTYPDTALSVTRQEIIIVRGEKFAKYNALKAWFEELKGQQRLPQF